MAKARIMIVEDEKITASHIRAKLEAFGYDVSATATTGEEAINYAKETHPDLVLMDIKLKGEMDGIEAASVLRSRFNIPVVYLTAYTDEEILERAKVTEPLGYLVKPFGSSELSTTLEMALYKHKMEKRVIESEKKYKTLFDASPEGIVLIGMDGTILDCNEATAKIGGMRKDELIGKPFNELSFLEEKNLSRISELFPKVMSGESTETVDLCIHPGDETIWIEAYPAILRKEDNIYALQIIIRDVTERKKIEEALKESEEKLRLLFANASEGIMYIDKLWNIIQVNPRALEILGCVRDEIIGENFLELLPSLNIDSTVISSAFQDILSGPSQFNIEWELTNKKGAHQALLAHISIIKKEDHVFGVSLILEDITGRRHAEKALRESEEKFRDLAELLPETIFLADETGKITFTNQAGFTAFGYNEEDIKKGFNVLEALAPEDRERGVENITKLSGQERVRGIEYTAMRKDGSTFPVIIYANKVTKDGVPAGLRGIVVDITDQKRAEEVLRERADIIEAMNDGVLLFDLDGRVVLANSAYCRLFDLNLEDVIGKSLFEIPGIERQKTEDLEKFHTLFNEIWERNEINPMEFTIIGKNNKRIPVSVSGGRIVDSKGNPIRLITVIRDITERKLAEEELIRSEKMAGIGTLASGIAHEINNPLAAIMGYAEIIQYEEDPKMMKEFAQKIVKSAERASDIVQWLSRYSREAKDSNILDVDLNNVIDESIEAIKHTRSTCDCDIKVDSKEIPPIRGNITELQQIMVNLLNNAIDSLQRNGEINISTRANDGYVEVKVLDNGQGISQEEINRIFEPFYTTKEVGEGTGLGLYIVSMLMKKHQGEISVESQEGQGTTFILKFPRK